MSPTAAPPTTTTDDVAEAARRAQAARTHLDTTIRMASSSGVTDADIVRASGLAKDTVRRILGKIEVKRTGRIRS